MDNMKILIILLLSCLIMTTTTGCLVCRHTVMADAAWAEEQKLDYKIVAYTVSPLLKRDTM